MSKDNEWTPLANSPTSSNAADITDSETHVHPVYHSSASAKLDPRTRSCTPSTAKSPVGPLTSSSTGTSTSDDIFSSTDGFLSQSATGATTLSEGKTDSTLAPPQLQTNGDMHMHDVTQLSVVQAPTNLTRNTAEDDLEMNEPGMKTSVATGTGTASTLDHVRQRCADASAGQCGTNSGHPESVVEERLQDGCVSSSSQLNVPPEDESVKPVEVVEVNKTLEDENDDSGTEQAGSLASIDIPTPVVPASADNPIPGSEPVDLLDSNTVEIINSPTSPTETAVSSVCIHLAQSSQDQFPQQQTSESLEQKTRSSIPTSDTPQKKGPIHRFKDIIRVRQESIPYMQINEAVHNIGNSTDSGDNRAASLKEEDIDVPDSSGHLPIVEMPAESTPHDVQDTDNMQRQEHGDLALATGNTSDNQSRPMTRTPSIIQCSSTVPLATNLETLHQPQVPISDSHRIEDSESNEQPEEASSWWTSWFIWTIPIVLITVASVYRLRNSL